MVFLTNYADLRGYADRNLACFWKTRGGRVVGRAVLQAAGVCSMCTGMESGHVCGQDAGRYESCCINRSSSTAVESAYSQHLGLMHLLLGMMWIFPSIIICAFVVVGLR
jgi:hypothetical protein